MEEPVKCLPVRKRMVERQARSGAPGKLWRSSRGRDQKLLGCSWFMCTSSELCCFTTQGFSDRMHYPKQLRDSSFWVTDKPISYLPVKGITSFLLSCPCTHQPGSLSHATAPSPSKWLQRAELTAKQPSWKGLSTQNYTWNLLDPYPEATVDIKAKSKLNIATV